MIGDSKILCEEIGKVGLFWERILKNFKKKKFNENAGMVTIVVKIIVFFLINYLTEIFIFFFYS
jgi:hypothetical protein